MAFAKGRLFLDPYEFLPLTPVAFEILLALGGGELHGYAVMQAVNGSSAQVVHPGTLYRAVSRLAQQGLLGEDDGGPSDRRRVYQLTPLGREVYAAEVARLSDQLARAAALTSTGRTGQA